MWITLLADQPGNDTERDTVTRKARAVALAKPGHVDSTRVFVDVENLGVPPPTRRDLLVEVRAVSVNAIDTYIRKGLFPPPENGILGFDAAGVVVDVGTATQYFEVGDPVYYAGQIDRDGAYTSHQLVDERIVGHKPRNVSFAEASSIPFPGLSAWEGLFDKLRLRADSTGVLLVTGAGGGMGSMVIQLARTLTEVRVLAAVTGRDEATWARGLGADVVSVGGGEDVLEEIRRAAPGGVDYAFVANPKTVPSTLVPIMNPFGQMVAVDTRQTEDLGALRDKALTWHWQNLFARPVHGAIDMTNQHRALDRIAELVEARQVRPPMTQLLMPVDARTMREAHRRVEQGRTIGKIVVARGDVTSAGLYPRDATVERVR